MRISDWSSDVCSSDLFRSQIERRTACRHQGRYRKDRHFTADCKVRCMAYLDRIDRYRHEIVAALSREFCAFKMARSTKRAFRRHSSHSSSTTESATMPEPTPKTADPSLADVSGVSRRVLIATFNQIGRAHDSTPVTKA